MWTLLGVLGGALLLIAGSSIYLAVAVGLGWLCPSVLPLTVLYFVLRAVRAGRRNPVGTPEEWAQHPLNQGPTVVELDETEFRYFTPLARLYIPWPAVRDVFDGRDAFWIALADESCLIPKRAFANARHAEQFAARISALTGRDLIRPV